jgi:hypothetical protein
MSILVTPTGNDDEKGDDATSKANSDTSARIRSPGRTSASTFHGCDCSTTLTFGNGASLVLSQVKKNASYLPRPTLACSLSRHRSATPQCVFCFTDTYSPASPSSKAPSVNLSGYQRWTPSRQDAWSRRNVSESGWRNIRGEHGTPYSACFLPALSTELRRELHGSR